MSDAINSLPYRKIQTTNNILIGVIVLLSILTAALGGAIYIMMPLKTIQTEFYEFNNASMNFIKIEKAGQRVQRKQALIAMFLKRYLADREVMDKLTESLRYRRVNLMSTPDVWKAFKETYNHKDSPLQKEGFKRDVEIYRWHPLSKNVFQIEYKTTDYLEGSEFPDINYWVVTLSYYFDEQVVSKEEETLNALGIMVNQYSIAKARYAEFMKDEKTNENK